MPHAGGSDLEYLDAEARSPSEKVQVYPGTVVVIVLATSHRVRVAKIGTASGSERLYKDRLWRVSGKQHQSPELSIHLV